MNMNEEQNYINFDEYIKASEPHKRERAEAWRVAIGLQAVDGLQVSEYLKQTARQHIEGEITIDEAREQIKQYYISKTQHDADDEEKLKLIMYLVISPNSSVRLRLHSVVPV